MSRPGREKVNPRFFVEVIKLVAVLFGLITAIVTLLTALVNKSDALGPILLTLNLITATAMPTSQMVAGVSSPEATVERSTAVVLAPTVATSAATPTFSPTPMPSDTPPPTSTSTSTPTPPPPTATPPPPTATPPPPTATATPPPPTVTPTPLPTATFAPGSIDVWNGTSFAYVPAGEFEGSQGAFWIGVYEITNAEFAVFLNRRTGFANRSEDGERLFIEDSARIGRVSAQWQVDAGSENLPAVYVTWFGARDYCQWLGGRLPAATEWRKAALWNPATGETLTFASGSYGDMTRAANVAGATSGLAPVGSFPGSASPTGAMDMIGNVWEWVQDASGINRLRMGFSWDYVIQPQDVQTLQSFLPASFATGNTGFRCAHD